MLWEAQVIGTTQYDVSVLQAPNGSLACSCDCPYAEEDYCKHVAAVLYAIEDGYPEYIGGGAKKPAAKKRLTKHDKLRQLLEKTPHPKLVTVLLDIAQQNREVLNMLLVRLDTGAAKPTDYKRLVKDAIRSETDHGYLDYGASNRAAKKVNNLLALTDQWLESGELEKALQLYQAVIDETNPAIQYADDSNGMLAGCIVDAVSNLVMLAEEPNEGLQAMIFEYCLARGSDKDFRDWDWGWELLGLATKLVKTPERRAPIDAALEAIKADLMGRAAKSSYTSTYYLERVAFLQLELIERFDGPEAAHTFLKAHSHLSSIRMELIEQYIAQSAFQDAMQHIQTGIETSQQNHFPGLTTQYRALEVKLLQKTGDKPSLIQATYALWKISGDPAHYTRLKETVDPEAWPTWVERLIQENSNNPRTLAWLYAENKRYQELLTLVKQRVNWSLLEEHRQVLELHFPNEIAALYSEILDRLLRNADNRQQYKQAMLYLWRIRQLGLEDKFLGIRARLQQEYAKRPALLDELSKI